MSMIKVQINIMLRLSQPLTTALLITVYHTRFVDESYFKLKLQKVCYLKPEYGYHL